MTFQSKFFDMQIYISMRLGYLSEAAWVGELCPLVPRQGLGLGPAHARRSIEKCMLNTNSLSVLLAAHDTLVLSPAMTQVYTVYTKRLSASSMLSSRSMMIRIRTQQANRELKFPSPRDSRQVGLKGAEAVQHTSCQQATPGTDESQGDKTRLPSE